MPAHTPEECDRLFGEHVNAGDVDALMTLYEPGGSLVRLDGSVATGHADIRRVLDRLVAMRPTLRMNVLKVVRNGEDIAMVYNDWTISAKGADGAPIERAGRAIEVVRRQADGTWRVAIDDPYARG
jgi:uncharacterized protein (TIGR02246 family)